MAAKHQPAGVYDVLRLNEQVECDRGFHVWTPQITVGDSILIRCVRCRHEERFEVPVTA